MSETYAGRMLRVYAELSEREVKALLIEEQAVTAEELAVVLACDMNETADQAAARRDDWMYGDQDSEPQWATEPGA